MTTAVIGTGGLGSVIARQLASGGETLRLSSADPESARILRRKGRKGARAPSGATWAPGGHCPAWLRRWPPISARSLPARRRPPDGWLPS